MIEPKLLEKITKRAVSEIIVEKEFVELLQDGKPLRLKMGFDPSKPDIHLGHVVGLRKLGQLQELGHNVVLIVGDWTAQIGDPSGQTVSRPMLTQSEVMANAETYLEQFSKVVDRNRTQTVLQSEWFNKFDLSKVIDLTRRFTVAQFLERDDFSNRFKANKPIAITELLYPLLQAYDSVAIKSDVEFGGTDQTFNLLVGRELQSMMGQRPQQCFLMPILVGTDGVQKMSKSFDNYIGVTDLPNDMYGKIMSLPDNLLIQYFEYLTDIGDKDLSEMEHDLETSSVNPMELKKRLGFDITSQFHDHQSAIEAQEVFERVFQHHLTPYDMPTIGTWIRLNKGSRGLFQRFFTPLNDEGDQQDKTAKAEYLNSHHKDEIPVTDLLVITGLVSSRNEAKRLIVQGGVEIDGKKLVGQTINLNVSSVIKVGKRRFVRLIDLDNNNSR